MVTDRRKHKDSEENEPQCQFIHHKSDMDYADIESWAMARPEETGLTALRFKASYIVRL